MHGLKRWSPTWSILSSFLAMFLSGLACSHQQGPTREQIEHWAEAKKKLPTAPFCFSGIWWSGNTIVHVAPGYDAYGIALGDTILAVDGIAYVPEIPSTQGSSMYSSWELAHHPGDSVALSLGRSGHTTNATIVCGDGIYMATLIVNESEDLLYQRWTSCLTSTATADNILGPLSLNAGIRMRCIAAEAVQNGWTSERGWDYAGASYEYASRLLTEYQFDRAHSEKRGEVIQILTLLGQKGYRRYAKDIEARLAQIDGQSLPLQATHRTSIGSCFAVRPDGIILTSNHITEGASTINVRFRDGYAGPAAVIVSSHANDLAIVKVPAATPVFLSLAPPRTTRIGQRVFTIGFPATPILGSEAKFSEGTISGFSGNGGEGNLLQISVPIQPGNSGGPLVTESGEVVGIIASTASPLAFAQITGALPQNVNWAVSADFARPLFSPASAPRAETRDEAISRVEAAICLIEASR